MESNAMDEGRKRKSRTVNTSLLTCVCTSRTCGPFEGPRDQRSARQLTRMTIDSHKRQERVDSGSRQEVAQM